MRQSILLWTHIAPYHIRNDDFNFVTSGHPEIPTLVLRRYKQMIAGAGAGHVQQVAFGVVDLLQI